MEEDTLRSTGRSTRLIDAYVQEFFTKEVNTPILVKDHFEGGSSVRTNRLLLDRLVHRLISEHRGVAFKTDHTNCTIRRL